MTQPFLAKKSVKKPFIIIVFTALLSQAAIPVSLQKKQQINHLNQNLEIVFYELYPIGNILYSVAQQWADQIGVVAVVALEA